MNTIENSSEKIIKAKELLVEAANELLVFLQEEKSYPRGNAISYIHQIKLMLQDDHYYSQHGQDRKVDEILKNKQKGIFVDIGGYDGIDGSNTLFFEQFRNWSGILIEPSHKQITIAKEIRKCPCLQFAVDKEDGHTDFLEVTSGYTQMSGFIHSYSESQLSLVRSNPIHEEIIHRMERRKISSILDEYKLKHIDFISLDVEGNELNILESFPFGRIDVAIWAIEDNRNSEEITTGIFNIMIAQGYQLVEFIGHDYIFVHPEKIKQ